MFSKLLCAAAFLAFFGCQVVAPENAKDCQTDFENAALLYTVAEGQSCPYADHGTYQAVVYRMEWDGFRYENGQMLCHLSAVRNLVKKFGCYKTKPLNPNPL